MCRGCWGLMWPLASKPFLFVLRRSAKFICQKRNCKVIHKNKHLKKKAKKEKKEEGSKKFCTWKKKRKPQSKAALRVL